MSGLAVNASISEEPAGLCFGVAKNLRRTSGPFLVFDSGSSIRISRVVEVLALAFNYGLAKPIADVY